MNHITDKNFKKEILDSKKPTLVLFGAPWCGPCKGLKKTISKLMPKYMSSLKFVYVDVRDVPLKTNEYMIRSVPTMVVFENGLTVGAIMGTQSLGSLDVWLSVILGVK